MDDRDDKTTAYQINLDAFTVKMDVAFVQMTMLALRVSEGKCEQSAKICDGVRVR